MARILLISHVFAAQDAKISTLRGKFLPAGITDGNEGNLKKRVAANAAGRRK
jgi:hypothetical protein